MSRHSSTSTSSHGEIEEKGEDGLVITSTSPPPRQPHVAHGDPEKQLENGVDGSLGRIHSNRRHLNNPAVPGVPLDDDSDLVVGQNGDERIVEGDDEDDDDDGDGDSAPRPSGGIAGVLDRVISRASTKSSWNPGPPPDGGVKAWTAVACAHLVIMNTWGYINSFGVFQAYYSSALDLPPSTIAWIGSVQVFLLFFIGTFTGRLTDAGYFRPVFLTGIAFQMLGIFTTSAATQYWQLFLAQGVCMGVGNGCLFCPAMATVSTYFRDRRSLAIGMTACGSATGGLVFPAMARQLLPTVGFGWTIRAIGFVQLAGLGVASCGLRTRVPPRKSGALVDWAAFKELEYTFYAAGSFSSFLGVYFAFYYLASFSRDIIGMSYPDSLNLLLLLNGIGVIGRLVPNYFADRYGAINLFIPTAVAAGACTLAWMGVRDAGGLYAWTVFYGVAGGGIQSLFPAGLSSLTTDLRRAGTRMGMVFTINSFATLVGPPIDGALVSRCGGAYWGAQTFAGVALLVGAGFMTAARVVRTRKVGGGWKVKV